MLTNETNLTPRSRTRPKVPTGLLPAATIATACVVIAVDGARLSTLTLVALFAVAVVALSLIRSMAGAQVEVDALARSEARFRALVQQSSDVTLIISAEGLVHYASPAVLELMGESSTTVEGSAISSLIHPEDAVSLGRFLRAAADGENIVAEWRVRRGDRWIWTENTASDLRSEPCIAGLVVSARDISERRSLEAKLTYQAYHDSLTRLANRSLFLNRVAHAIVRAPRGRQRSAVLFLDLDNFKKVNDSLGHAAGDELLVVGAGRLAACIRPGDTLARLGGDEFAVLLEGIHDLSDAIPITERICAAMQAPFTIQGRDVFASVSVGLAEVTPDITPDDVLRNADLAMYFAKTRDKGRYAIYAPAMHTQLVDRLELEADLRAAVDADEIAIEYQPIVHLHNGEVYGAEALVRWHHPRRGVVEPATFVGVAEETGLMLPLSRRVLQLACEQAQRWRRDRRRAQHLQLSVNLSGRHFMDPALIPDVSQVLKESGLAARALTLEIAESVVMQRSESTLERLSALKALGVRLAIDDFGTGHSSLGYLQRFPIDILKIDRIFVDALTHEASEPVLAQAIIALGRTLRLETIAEGIERAEQRDSLRALGCELGQGFFFSRSLTAETFDTTLLREAEVARATPSPIRVLRPTPVS